MATDHLENAIQDALGAMTELNRHIDINGPELVDDHEVEAERMRRRVDHKAMQIVLASEHAEDALERLNEIAENSPEPVHALALRDKVRAIQSEEYSEIRDADAESHRK